MLTRLRIKGFKSLADVEASFGPFTCIAGTNGVGKSNLFDAIQFLRDLAEFPIIEAAARVRDPAGRTGDIRAIFTQNMGNPPLPIQFEADFIVPDQIRDDFNRQIAPTATYLTYRLTLRYVEAGTSGQERIELVREELDYVPKSEARVRLGFPSSSRFRESAIKNKRRGTKFISTEMNSDGQATIQLHQDGGSKGPPFRVPALASPKTIVSGINTTDYPTVLAARREMQGWTQLQLEPSALRQPDSFSAEGKMASNGAHMPSTLLRLGVESEVTNRLADLLDDINAVSVEHDESRRTNTLNVTARDGISHPARSLSDGTLRFLALAIFASDSDACRLLCLEEPENGIHPTRIPAILKLLQDMAVDPNDPIGPDNPLRQIIINTHSPLVVSSLNENDLLVARVLRQAKQSHTVFECIAGSWRHEREVSKLDLYPLPAVPPGALLAYVGDLPSKPPLLYERTPTPEKKRHVRSVKEYMRVQLQLDIDHGEGK